ncbi:hypothetical protein PAMP_012954 [Pampus punctatissimus]
MEKQRTRKEKFSLFGSRSTNRTTNPPSSSSSSSSPVIPSPGTTVKRADHPRSSVPGLSKAEFLERVRRSNQACQQGEYTLAVRLYTDALTADPQNCILYSNRSAAYLRLGQYSTALDDAIKARLINPKWPKAYFRQGVALQYLGRHADALAAFASGLAQDPKSLQLLVGMVEAAMKSPLRDTLEPTYQQLQKMKLDKSPFVVVSVIGQELLTHGFHGASVVVLEAGLKIGTCSLKLRGSVFSALSSAYWSLGNTEKSMAYMQQDLDVTKTLGDQSGECRSHGNLGSALFSKGNYREALANHRNQLVLAMKLKDREAASDALSSLGHVYTAIGDYPNALASHKQCVLLARQTQCRLSEARQLGNMGAVYTALGDFTNAVQCHEQHLDIAKTLENRREEARAYSNLGSAYHSQRDFDKAISYHTRVLELAQELVDRPIEMRAYAGLGHAARCMQDLERARQYHEHQLEIAQELQDRAAQGRASSNLGAVRFYQQQLALAQKVHDQKMEADAYSALGSVHRLLRQLDTALSFHSQELTVRKDLGDQQGECRALGHLAAVHMALGDYATTFQCYETQLGLAQGLRDARLEAQVHGNMGITKMNMGVFEEAIGYFEQQLAMLQQLSGTESMLDRGRAYGNLADCYDALGDYEEAIQYYEKYLTVAQSLNHIQDQDKAYRGLGNAHRSMGSLQQALVCFEKRLVVAHELGGEGGGKAQAYGELGTLHSQLGNYEQALSCLEHQLNIARTAGDKSLEAEASDILGGVYQLMADNETALQWHQRALNIAEQTGCVRSQGRAYGNLGLTYEALGNYERAVVFQEQHLSVAAQTNDLIAKTLAYGSLGRTHHALQNYAQAVMYLQEGLRLAEQLGRREDEAKIRHRLNAQVYCEDKIRDLLLQLYRASTLFETIRHETQHCTDYKLSLFDLQTSSYQALQRVLVSLGRHDEALAIAERGRTRAFADLLVERQKGSQHAASADPYIPVTVEHILETVNGQRAMVLYYSLAGGFLYSWLISPGTGIVKFNEVYLGEASDFQDAGSPHGGGVSGSPLSLEQYICNAREALGVDSHCSRVGSSSETESEAGDLLEQQFEELNNKLTSATDPTGYLRMVSRNNRFNRSCQSMSSLYSTTVSPAKDSSSSPPYRPSNISKPPLRALYDLLIAPMEGGLMHSSGPVGRHRQLVLVLEGELYLIPFALLKGSSSNEYLYERFSLISVPSLASLGAAIKPHPRRGGPLLCSDGGSVSAVVGAPRLPHSVMDRWLWGPLPSAHDEALWLGEQLGCHPLTGADATKERVLSALSQAECVHFATHISWKLAALVLAPSPELSAGDAAGGRPKEKSPCGASTSGDTADQDGRVKSSFMKSHSSPERLRGTDEMSEDGESVCEVESVCDSPPLQDFLLTAADILDLCLTVKLVVLRSYPESSSRVSADGVVGLTRAFLAAGVQCVCVSLWPVTIAASKLFTHTFYTALLNGTKASSALTEAMKTLQSSKHFSHPSNWAGYMLIGSDVKLNSPMSLVGQALAEILQYPERARDALRVLLHLVEKSLQRIQSGQCNPMYTSQQSVENKVSGVPGWQALLSAVGFRLDVCGNGAGLPAAVFFPTSDPGDRLQQCSTTLQSLLGLTPAALQALCKLVTASEAGEQLIHKLHQVLVQLQSGEKEQDFSLAPIQVLISVQLWRLPGCHEFLAALGGARGFQPSETSAFSRPPSRASLKASSSPLSLRSPLSPLSTSVSTPPPARPKPPSRSSSLQKINSCYNSPAHSSSSLSLSVKEQGSPDVHAQLKLKYPTSPYTAHTSPSHSPADSAPSPVLSYSSTGSVSASSSPANTPEIYQSKQDNKVQAIHNLKTFWANSAQKHEVPCPVRLLRGGNKKMSTVQKDVLGLLNLSPRHEPVSKDVEGSEGHQTLEAKPPPPSDLPTNSKGGVRLHSGNGYKFLSPGHFFPSSKC